MCIYGDAFPEGSRNHTGSGFRNQMGRSAVFFFRLKFEAEKNLVWHMCCWLFIFGYRFFFVWAYSVETRGSGRKTIKEGSAEQVMVIFLGKVEFNTGELYENDTIFLFCRWKVITFGNFGNIICWKFCQNFVLLLSSMFLKISILWVFFK